MTFNTQTNSKPRLKNDVLGEDTLRELYSLYETLALGQFKIMCEQYVQMGGGKQARKDEITAAIRQSTKKEAALKKAQDFILAGMGLGV
jgi:hypothetical protein